VWINSNYYAIYNYRSNSKEFLTQIEIFQGTVIFVVEETGFDGTVSSLEYVCENKLQQDHILIGRCAVQVTVLLSLVAESCVWMVCAILS